MERAISQLSEKLRHPSDLQTRLETTGKMAREQCEHHRGNLTKMISKCYSLILGSSQSISELEQHVRSFIENKDKNVDVLRDFFSLIRDSKTVKLVCLAHSNLCRVIEFGEKLKTIGDPIATADMEVYHSRVYEAEDFGCKLEMYKTDISREDYIEVSKALNTIEKNSLDFTAKILEIVEDFIGNHEVMGKIVEVVEKEEKRDEVTRRVQEGERSSDPVLREMYRMYRMYVTRKPKQLRDKVVKAVEVSVESKFERLRHEEIFVNKLDFVVRDLEFIKENMELRFYPFDDMLMLYHRRLKRFLDENTSRLDAGEILAIIEYVGNYYSTVESKFNKIADALGRKLLENETELLERYTLTVQGKLKEWITNITRMEVDKFYSRSEEPPRDEEDRLISPGFISLLQIIRMQLEPIAFNKRIFAHVTRTVVGCCGVFKDALLEAMDKDFRASCEMSSKAGYEDFCIMFGNSGLKITQYITSLPQCQNDEVRELGNIFLDILRASNTFLSEFIIYSCQPAIDKVFTAEWYDNSVTKVIVLTLRDFLDDYRNTMSEYSFVTFIHDLCNSVTLAYMKQLGRRRAVVTPDFGRALKSDHTRLCEVMCEYGDSEDVKTCLSPMLKIIPLIESRNDDLFVVELKALKMVYPDIKRSFIKTIVKKRQDLADEDKKRLIGRLRECFEDVVSKEKTIFSRLFSL